MIAKILFWVVLLAAGAACLMASYRVRKQAEERVFAEAALARDEARRIQEQVILFKQQIVPKSLRFSAMLEELGIDRETAARAAASAQSVFDLRHLRAGK